MRRNSLGLWAALWAAPCLAAGPVKTVNPPALPATPILSAAPAAPALPASAVPAPAAQALSAVAVARPGRDAAAAVFDGLNPASDSVWTELEAWIGGDLGLPLAEPRRGEWKSAAAAILRNSPSTPLPEVLAKASGRAHALAPAAERDLAAFLGREPIMSLPGGFYSQTFKTKGGVYALANGGLHVKTPGGWKTLLAKAAQGFFTVDGETLYVGGEDHHIYEIEGDRARVLIRDGHQASFVARHQGRAYMGTALGVYARDGGAWKKEPGLDVFVSGGMVELDGRLFAAGSRGLYEKGKDGWKILIPARDGLYSPLGHGDRLFLIDADLRARVYNLESGRLTPVLPHREVSDFFTAGGRMYARTSEDLFEYERGEWTQALKEGFNGSAKVHGADLYVDTDREVLRRRDGRWRVVHQAGVDGIYALHEHEGLLYAATGKGLYEVKEDAWVPVVRGERVVDLAGDGRTLFLGTDEGVKAVTLEPAHLLDWRERVTRALEGILGQAASLMEKTFEPDRSGGEEDGVIRDARGRAIFSALARWVGGRGLDFPGEAPSAGPWADLERRLLGVIGGGFGGSVSDWKKEAASLLRNTPAIDLARALGRAFGNVYMLDSTRSAMAEELFSMARISDVRLRRHVFRVAEAGGALYASTGAGLYRRGQGGRWERMFGVSSPVRDVAFFDGVPYAATENGVYRPSAGGTWKRTLEWDTFQLSAVNGTFYASTQVGLFALEGGRWKKRWSPPWQEKAVYHVMESEGALHAATNQGLYRQDAPGFWARWARKIFGWALRPGWSVVFEETVFVHQFNPRGDNRRRQAVQVHQSAWEDGNFYVATDHGLYVRRGDVWQVRLNTLNVRRLVRISRRLYAVTDEGLFADRDGGWVPAFSAAGKVYDLTESGGVIYLATDGGLRAVLDLGKGWQEPFLKNIGAELGQAVKLEAFAAPDLERTPEGQITAGKGRVIFDVPPDKNKI